MGAAMTGAEPDAAERARAFVHAIVWAEHTTLWDLLSGEGRTAALSVAMRNGLDRVVAARIHDDLADPLELQRFLQQLVEGLRRDLRSVELTELTVSDDSRHDDGTSDDSRHHDGTSDDSRHHDGTVAVELLTPSQLPGIDAWPAGRLVLSHDPERGWLVDRLEPRLAGP